MIRPHVTLRTGGGEASYAHRTGVPGVTNGTVPDSAVGVRLPHAVALITSAGFGRGSFQFSQWIGGASSAARLVGFRKTHLFGRQSFLAVNRGPGRCGVATAEKFLINVLVAAAAVSRRQLGGDDESVVILLFLALGGLVAFEAVHALAGVHAHLELVHHRILGSDVTFCAFSGGPDQVGSRLLCLYLRSGAIEQERCQNESKCNHDGDEDRAKRHTKPPLENSHDLGRPVWTLLQAQLR